MKVRSNQVLDAVQVTAEMVQELNVRTIREMIGGVTSAEITQGRVIINTRKNRYRIGAGYWIVRDHFGNIETVSDKELREKYDIIDES